MKGAIQKLYYSITEVSKIVGEEQHVLRYWEREFAQLRPQKNRAGNRVYTQRDLAMLRVIRRLLRSERYTVAGAKEYLRQHGSQEELEQEFLEDEQQQEVISQEELSSQGAEVDESGDLPSRLTEDVKEVVGELRSIAAELRSRAST
ncbi:MAG: MerR family transcriptional regulator [bacterium]|nr:MerR family transcriptional regulator [bacterium]